MPTRQVPSCPPYTVSGPKPEIRNPFATTISVRLRISPAAGVSRCKETGRPSPPSSPSALTTAPGVVVDDGRSAAHARPCREPAVSGRAAAHMNSACVIQIAGWVPTQNRARPLWSLDQKPCYTMSLGRFKLVRSAICQTSDWRSELAPISWSTGQDQDLNGLRRLTQGELHSLEAINIGIDQCIVEDYGGWIAFFP